MHTPMLLALLCMFAAAHAAAVPPMDSEEAFDAFAARYGRTYATAAERAFRFGVFRRLMQRAAELGRANPQASFGPTPFADLTEEEWSKFLGRRRSAAPNVTAPARTGPLRVTPAAIDWRTKGVVGPIKNQGQCGSCWAFSTIASIESQWALAGNPLTSLSEQQIVSCDPFDQGCDGGDTLSALQWLIFRNGGDVASEAAYPYNPSEHKCRPTPPTARIEGYLNIERQEDAMAQWCGSNGPVSICIDANSLQLYSGGILTTCPSKTINHCVAIVGYNTTNPTPYWVVRNSWGTGWGERGYFRAEMGHNLCGITSEPVSALVHRPPPKTNVTFYGCTDAACSSCKTMPMEEGQCSDGGLKGSMVAKCSGAEVHVEEFAQEACDGRHSRTYTAAAGTCLQHKDGYYKLECAA